MKIFRDTIFFKSTPDNFKKEKEGLKCNTIRRISRLSEMKEFEEWLTSPEYNAFGRQIIIENSKTAEEFKRDITDITEFEGLWVISWRHK